MALGLKFGHPCSVVLGLILSSGDCLCGVPLDVYSFSKKGSCSRMVAQSRQVPNIFQKLSKVKNLPTGGPATLNYPKMCVYMAPFKRMASLPRCIRTGSRNMLRIKLGEYMGHGFLFSVVIPVFIHTHSLWSKRSG